MGRTHPSWDPRGGGVSLSPLIFLWRWMPPLWAKVTVREWRLQITSASLSPELAGTHGHWLLGHWQAALQCSCGISYLYAVSTNEFLFALHPLPSTILGMRAAHLTENEVTKIRLFYFSKWFSTLMDKLGSGKILCHGQHLSPMPHVSRKGWSHQTQKNMYSGVQKQTKLIHGGNTQNTSFL